SVRATRGRAAAGFESATTPSSPLSSIHPLHNPSPIKGEGLEVSANFAAEKNTSHLVGEVGAHQRAGRGVGGEPAGAAAMRMYSLEQCSFIYRISRVFPEPWPTHVFGPENPL